MQKTIVGDWGSELEDRDYACALAALGVLEFRGSHQHSPSSNPVELARVLEEEFTRGERTVIWRGRFGFYLNTTNENWRTTVHEDAAALAAAWREYRGAVYHERQLPRMGIPLAWRDRSDLFDFNELYAWLNHDDVGLAALVLADQERRRSVGAWHWPLRVGVPLGTEEWVLSALQTARSDYQWVEFLSRCYSVGGSRDSCDLLILTRDAAEALLTESRTHIRARFIVCLDEPPSSPAEIPDSFVELRDRVQAAGLSIIGDLNDTQNIYRWFTDVIHDLSHDVPIHAVVGAVGRSTLNRDLVTLGNAWVLDQCRVLGLAKQQDYVANLLAYDQKVAFEHTSDPPDTSGGGEGEEPVFGGPGSGSSTEPPSPSLPDSLQKRLADDLRERMFTSESVDGVSAVEDLNQRQDDIERTRNPRWIQANAWRPDAPERNAPSLAPEQWNLLTVHIGPTAQRRFDAAFPDHYIDYRQGNVAVSVQLHLQGAELIALNETYPGLVDSSELSDPRNREHVMYRLRVELARTETEESTAPPGLATSEITLPPVGNSTVAPFAVRPHDRVTEAKGSILIIHNNRILQTASVSIEIGETPDEGTGLNLVADAPIHPGGLEDLDERREYDVAILVSDIGGKLHLTVQRDGKVKLVQLDDLGSPISDLRKALEAASVNWDHAKSMSEQTDFADNLYTLAASGSALKKHLVDRYGDSTNEWERIHLVPATNEFLPLEYVYDGPPPRSDATACPNILGALEREGCANALETPAGPSPCPNLKDSSFVCPMHFWGFQKKKVIERSGTIQPPASGMTQPAPVCVPSKQPYGKLEGMLFAASDRAFLFENDPPKRLAARASLIKDLGEISTIADAADWDEWRQKIKGNPNLLVLVVHTTKHRGVRSLEIGDKRPLGYHEILQDVSGAAGRPQLLILLGCSAAEAHENFQPYPERFRDAGVSIVLAPVATIRGADAVPIARRITQVLAERLGSPEPIAFGDLLPILRRELLRKGHPGVMSIVGFGDGDWLLGGA